MPIAESLRRGLKYVYGVGLALYVAAPAYAFTPSQVPLLSGSAVIPNVMLQVDNSGSMDTIIFDSGFDASKSWPTVYEAAACSNYYYCSGYERGTAISTSPGDYVTLSSLTRTGCSNAYTFWRTSTASAICVPLPDPAGSRTTRYPGAYLSYLINSNVTLANIPTQSRMTTAIDVALGLVDANRSLRIGLASYNPVTNSDRGPGGNIKRPVLDLSPVAANAYQTGVSQSTANSNYSLLRSAISALSAEANTPLAETYYQVTRYFRGLSPSPSYSGSPSTFTSPIQYRCQKNYGVVLTDGLPTYDKTFPTNDPDDPNRWLPNWDRVNNDGPNRTESDEGDTLYLDDIARFAYDIDLRKDSSTPSRDLTGKSWDLGGFPKQNLNTYTIGFTLDNQMLLDAADDSHGRGKYFQANDAAGLTSALNLALSDIYAKAGSGGGGASNSATLQSGTRFFQTFYDPTDWHGTIKAYDLNATTGAISSAVWNTDTTISSSSTAPTFETWNTATLARVALDYATLSKAQQGSLNDTLPTGVTGAQLIAWAKGTASARLRTRTRLLGDLINTNLAAALPTEKTSTDFGTSGSYTTYLANKAKSMTYNLLANANDGFFNVINAGDGRRTYAYMPSSALTSLGTVAATTYGSGVHKFTADGQISVFDTQASSGSSWRTVAVSGLGAGGKSFFAIKLFEGTANNVSALWEVSAPDTANASNVFNNLGYSYSKPEAARMADGTGIVVVGNGYGSSTGRASLFVLNANTGALIAEISTPMIGSAETDNGLSSVRLRVNAQNVVQAAYAGDLKGRMWKFDMSGASASSWKLAFGGKPLFTAPTEKGLQPITVQPLILDHPLNGKIIYFGTGKFLETPDKQVTSPQAFYAVWDADGGTGGFAVANLLAQEVGKTVSGSGATYFTSSEKNVDWTLMKGWYMPLSMTEPYLGERIIFPAQTSRGRIIFTTAAVNSSDPCESTGIGRLFELDAATGSMLTYPVLDTNGDTDVNTYDIQVAGRQIGSGIPVLSSILAGTISPGLDNEGNPKDPEDQKILIDSSGNVLVMPEEGGKGSGSSGGNALYQRIMWRQIQ